MDTTSEFLRPDSILHIYYVKGIVPPHRHIDSQGFIGTWVEEDFSFLFFDRPAGQDIAEFLGEYPELTLLDEYEMTYGQWQGGKVEPVRIGRFIINPTWIKASPQKGEIAITLDAGVVFGNGLHASTQACLEAMEIATAGDKVRSMLDLGCGTGILALAGARLGCERILALDYNFLAARTTMRNVSLNGLDDRILVVNGRAEDHAGQPADLLVANIHYQVMKELVRSPGFLNHTWFVLSGLLRSEAEKILDYLKCQPVLILKRWNQDDIWHTILGITRP